MCTSVVAVSLCTLAYFARRTRHLCSVSQVSPVPLSWPAISGVTIHPTPRLCLCLECCIGTPFFPRWFERARALLEPCVPNACDSISRPRPLFLTVQWSLGSRGVFFPSFDCPWSIDPARLHRPRMPFAPECVLHAFCTRIRFARKGAANPVPRIFAHDLPYQSSRSILLVIPAMVHDHRANFDIDPASAGSL